MRRFCHQGLHRPDKRTRDGLEQLSGHFGLTLDEIAEQRETSPVTAKNQMAQILGETETHRRSDLVRLILKTHPPTK